MPTDPTRTLHYQQGETWKKLTIPASARVTFGPLIPGRQDGHPMRTQGLYLRVYKTKDHQLAVIPNVVQFWDSDVVIEEPTTEGYSVVTEETLLGNMVETELKRGSGQGPNCPECGNSTRKLGKTNSARLHFQHEWFCDSCQESF